MLKKLIPILLLIALLFSSDSVAAYDTWIMISPSGAPEIRGLHSKARKGWDSWADQNLAYLEANKKAGIPNNGTAWYNTWGIESHYVPGKNPGDKPRVVGDPYEWNGRIRCQQAVAAGNYKLAKIVDDDAMLRAMNKIGDAGYKIMIYVGSPHRVKALPGESKQAWVDRTLGMLGAVNHYRGDLTIGMDATYGHQDYHPDANMNARYGFTGGENGSVAMLTRELVARGITVLYESHILSTAHWAHDICGCLCIDRTHWSNAKRLPITTQFNGKPFILDWGFHTPFPEHDGEKVVQLTRTHGQSVEKLNERIDEWHAKRCSVVINVSSTPGYYAKVEK